MVLSMLKRVLLCSKFAKFFTPRRFCPLSPLLDLATLTTVFLPISGRPRYSCVGLHGQLATNRHACVCLAVLVILLMYYVPM